MSTATERTGKYSALKVYTEECMCVCLYTQEIRGSIGKDVWF